MPGHLHPQGTALVKAVQPEGVTLAWNAWQDPPPPPPVTLLLAMPRPKVLRRLWRQLAELGVSRIVLTVTETVPAGYSTSTALRPHAAILDVLQARTARPPWIPSRSSPTLSLLSSFPNALHRLSGSPARVRSACTCMPLGPSPAGPARPPPHSTPGVGYQRRAGLMPICQVRLPTSSSL